MELISRISPRNTVAAGILTTEEPDEPWWEGAVLERKNLAHFNFFNALMRIQKEVKDQAISCWIGNAFASYNTTPKLSGIPAHDPQSMILNNMYRVCPTGTDGNFAGSPCFHAFFSGLK